MKYPPDLDPQQKQIDILYLYSVPDPGHFGTDPDAVRILGSVSPTNGPGCGSRRPKKTCIPTVPDPEFWYLYIIL
jgi:hypothetical protein